MTDRAAEATRLARELIIFCAGMQEAFMDRYAHRASAVARETIWLAEQLEAERSSRRLMQDQRDEVRIALARLSAEYHLGDADKAAV